jgi:uncharacterized membrane protein
MRRTQSLLFSFPIAILILLLLGWFVFSQIVFPGLFSQNYDPEMAYLFSSLNVVKGQPIVYIDHPGTPMQLAGALILLVTYPLAKWSGSSFITYTLRNPYPFFFLARGFVLLFSAFTAVMISRQLFSRRSGSLAVLGASVAAMYFIIHPYAVTATTIWSHNSFNYAAGTLFLLLFLQTVRGKASINWKTTCLYSFFAGILTSITIYLGCWVIGTGLTIFLKILLQKEGLKKAVLHLGMTGAGSGLGFLVATLPILGQYPRFLEWIFALLIHQGRYGKGEVGFLSPELFSARVNQLLFLQTPGILVSAFLFAILAIWFYTRLQKNRNLVSEASGLVAFLIAISVQLIINVVIILRHPAFTYLMSAAATIPILIGAVLDGLDRMQPIPKKISAAAGTLALLLVSAAFFSAGRQYLQQRNEMIRVEQIIEQTISGIAQRNQIPKNELNIYWTYGLYNPCFALWFGNDYGGNRLADSIQAACPGEYNLNVFDVHTSITAQIQASPMNIVITRQAFTKKEPSINDGLASQIIPFTISDGYGPVIILENPSLH